MPQSIALLGKIFSIFFWILVGWSLFTSMQAWYIPYIQIIGGITLFAHVVECGLFLTQARFRHYPKALHLLQILLFGVFHLKPLQASTKEQ
ncbi:MAG: DUF1145 domain-containing protein [Chitinophagales bacterium]|nr:DUF1145 domain-containing protein [Chitinophagales bacterium]